MPLITCDYSYLSSERGRWNEGQRWNSWLWTRALSNQTLIQTAQLSNLRIQSPNGPRVTQVILFAIKQPKMAIILISRSTSSRAISTHNSAIRPPLQRKTWPPSKALIPQWEPSATFLLALGEPLWWRKKGETKAAGLRAWSVGSPLSLCPQDLSHVALQILTPVWLAFFRASTRI